jgi:SAM-dependent methyltransferase
MSAMFSLTPSRRRGREILDDPSTDTELAKRSLRDVARSNALFGGTRAVVSELRAVLRDTTTKTVSLLDVGCGVGDIACSARVAARREGRELIAIGLEKTPALAVASSAHMDATVCGDAETLPLRDGSVDIVMCSQVLHHFPDDQALKVLREMARVARRAILVSDLRRSWIAIAGLWTASYPLGFHPVSRHDGIVSIRRGYTERELHDLVRRATGRTPRVRSRAGFRITAMVEVS